MHHRSLGATTIAIVTAMVLLLGLTGSHSQADADVPGARPLVEPRPLPVGYPTEEQIAAAAAERCAALPIPGRSSSDVSRCERYFALYAQQAAIAAFETGAGTQQELNAQMCGERDCMSRFFGAELESLSKYQKRRVQLTMSLAFDSSLSYVGTYVS